MLLLLALASAVVFEGAMRKWVLSIEFHPAAYFMKDAVGVLLLLLAFLDGSLRGLGRYSKALLISVVLAFPFFVGVLGDPVGAVLTFKNAVIWVAVAPAVAGFIRQVPPVKTSRVIAFLAVLECAVGVLQFFSAPDAFVNQYAWAKLSMRGDIAGFGDGKGVRATGTFSYIAGYASFAIVVCSWSAYRLTKSISREEANLSLLALASALVAAIASGSRGSVYVCCFIIGVLVLYIPNARMRLRIAGGASAAVLVLAAANGPALLSSFGYRARTAGDSFTGRVVGKGASFLSELLLLPAGAGLGSESQTKSLRVSRTSRQIRMAVVEDGRTRAVQEAGIFAIVALILTLTPIAYFCRRRFRAGRRAHGEMLCVGLPLVWAITNVQWFDHNGTALWWILFGLWVGHEVPLGLTFRHSVIGGPIYLVPDAAAPTFKGSVL